MDNYHHATVMRVGSPCTADVSAVCVLGIARQVILERFGIDDARELVRQAYQRPREGERQVLVVCTDFITHEAQNALLKVLEEPPLSTQFLFVLPPDFSLLPTLASRFQVVSAPPQTATAADFVQFLSLSYQERISLIETKLKQSDTLWQRAMKLGLITYLEQGKNQQQLAELEYVARTLLTRGASNKMLFEQLALTMAGS
jgi:DNA polymerase III delta prime subunit